METLSHAATRIELAHVSEVLHVQAADARTLPWKNGRGVTRELLLWPPHARFERGDFDWRLSAARVEESGPFSTFPEHERVLVVTSGAGLVLTHGDDAPRARVRALEPYRFDGAWSTRGELLDGGVADFNVFARTGHTRAEVEVLRLGARRARSEVSVEHVVVHALDDALRVRIPGEDESVRLAAGDTLSIRGLGADQELELHGLAEATVVLVVRFERIGERET